jgi:hypothetical protein
MNRTTGLIARLLLVGSTVAFASYLGGVPCGLAILVICAMYEALLHKERASRQFWEQRAGWWHEQVAHEYVARYGDTVFGVHNEQ